jgi:hypothetical protein
LFAARGRLSTGRGSRPAVAASSIAAMIAAGAVWCLVGSETRSYSPAHQKSPTNGTQICAARASSGRDKTAAVVG